MIKILGKICVNIYIIKTTFFNGDTSFIEYGIPSMYIWWRGSVWEFGSSVLQFVIEVPHQKNNTKPPLERVLTEKLIVQLGSQIPHILWNLELYFHVCKRHWTLSWVRWIRLISSHHISLKSILTLPSYLCLDFWNGFIFQISGPTSSVALFI